MSNFTEIIERMDLQNLTQGMDGMELTTNRFKPRNSHRSHGPSRWQGEPVRLDHSSRPIPSEPRIVRPAYRQRSPLRRRSLEEPHVTSNSYLDPTLTVLDGCERIYNKVREISREIEHWQRALDPIYLENTIKFKRGFVNRIKDLGLQMSAFSAVLRHGRSDWDFTVVPESFFTAIVLILDRIVEETAILQDRGGRTGVLVKESLWVAALLLRSRIRSLKDQRAAMIMKQKLDADNDTQLGTLAKASLKIE